MTDIAKEDGLGAIKLGQCLRALALFFISAGVGDGAGDVATDKLKKRPEGRVQALAGVDGGEHESKGRVLAGLENRKNYARARGSVPSAGGKRPEKRGQVLNGRHLRTLSRVGQGSGPLIE